MAVWESILFMQVAAMAVILLMCTGGAQAANCSAITCYNGGTCNNVTASPPCLCPLPYIAPNCIAAVDYCSTLQLDKNITTLPVCRNGGNCTMIYSDPYFVCSCSSEFKGSRCEGSTATEATTGSPASSPAPSSAHSTLTVAKVSTAADESAIGTTSSKSTAPLTSVSTATSSIVAHGSTTLTTDIKASTWTEDVLLMTISIFIPLLVLIAIFLAAVLYFYRLKLNGQQCGKTESIH